MSCEQDNMKWRQHQGYIGETWSDFSAFCFKQSFIRHNCWNSPHIAGVTQKTYQHLVDGLSNDDIKMFFIAIKQGFEEFFYKPFPISAFKVFCKGFL